MKRKKLFVCFAVVLSLSVLSVSPLLLKQETHNTAKNNTNIMICGDKTVASPVNIHSVGSKYI